MCDRTSPREGLNHARGLGARGVRRARTLRWGWVGRRPGHPLPGRGWRPRGGLRMDRREGERQGGEGGRGGPALQQLLPACDSPVPAMQLEQSHTAQWGGRGHRVPFLSPWGPSWEIQGSALPSPPQRSPCRGGGNASRAQTPPPPPPPLPPPPSPRPGACCCRRRRGIRRVLGWVEERREPSRLPAAGKAQPARHDAGPARPGLPRAAPEHLRAPAGPRALSAPRYRILHQKHVK